VYSDRGGAAKCGKEHGFGGDADILSDGCFGSGDRQIDRITRQLKVVINCADDSLEETLAALVRIVLHGPHATYADDRIYHNVPAV
jgi:hypothetical protein